MSGSGPFSDDRGCQGFVRTLVSMRTLAGWSQPELAARCHFSKGVISNIESFPAPRGALSYPPHSGERLEVTSLDLMAYSASKG